jgi:hypothetical protein
MLPALRELLVSLKLFIAINDIKIQQGQQLIQLHL